MGAALTFDGTFDGLTNWGAFGQSQPAPCPSSFDPAPADQFTPLVAEQWEGMEADGPLWITEAIGELVGDDRREANVPRLCRPELDTFGMAPGVLLQVLFGRAHVADRDILAAAKALRDLLHAYGDGEAARRANHVITMECV